MRLTIIPLQLQQVINLVFLFFISYILGYFYLDWKMFFSLLFFTIVIEHLFIYIKYGKVDYFSFSALTTSLGVMLMMIAGNILIYLCVITLALGQKHFLTLSGKHFFNPSNFALLMAMFLFYHDAHIVLGQLGDEFYLRVIVLGLGIIILGRAKRLIIPLTFIIVYIGMQYFFIISYDMTLVIDDIYLRFYSVSFIVFILFMLTDPKTTPDTAWLQTVFAFFVASLSVGFDRLYGFRVQHLFMSLFMISPIFVLFEVYVRQKYEMKEALKYSVLILLVLGVIIFIESQPPYYFEMD